MKAFYLVLFGWLLALPRLATAQLTPVDTTGGRYYRPVFASVAVSSNVVYGSATTYSGSTQTLLMDVYQPAGDTVKRRPLIIFAHSGGFLIGSKTDAYPVAFCTRLARLGYVVASIEYRLGYAATGISAPADTGKIAAAAVRGGHDMKAAVRFFRQDAATTKTYRVYSNYIVAAGSSAGAFMSLETGYLDKASEVPTYVNLAALGGIEGSSGNPGYSSAVAAVINLCGATESPAVIEAGNVPLCSAHGTADATVPYFQGKIGSYLPPKYAYGSGRLNPRASALGITNVLRRFSKAGHVPFETLTTNGQLTATAQLYGDTVFYTVRDFLRPLLLRPGTVLAARAGATAAVVQAYPNPSADAVQLVLPANWQALGEAEMLDAAGRVVRRFRPQAQTVQLTRSTLPAGLYLVRFASQVPVKVIFE